MTDGPRIRCKAVVGKVMPAEDAAAFITPGDRVGMSGFTVSATRRQSRPRWSVVPPMRPRGDRFVVSVWTGSFTAPELDGALAAVDGIDLACLTSPTR